jgi:hypothetical protein
VRTRSILTAALLGGLTIAPRCATNAGSEKKPDRARVAPVSTASGVVGTPAPRQAEASPVPPAAPAPRQAVAPLTLDPPVAPGAPVKPPASSADAFRDSVRPVLSARCGKCHDPGGRMYARLPFDDPGVVSSHGDRILGRLKGEDRATVEKWLAGLAPAGAAR